ncbi:MAG TPA: PilZ domain-containing protein [Xanthobacteraceae bacterium]|nr:PilZ domain-containing protein [Xanthobacteraceae bacterium]
MVVIGSYRTRTELRKHPRRPFKYNAKIAAGKGKPLLDCMIVDVSEGGARICLARDVELPQIFILILTRDGSTRRHCQTLRREGTVLGVRFIAAP